MDMSEWSDEEVREHSIARADVFGDPDRLGIAYAVIRGKGGPVTLYDIERDQTFLGMSLSREAILEILSYWDRRGYVNQLRERTYEPTAKMFSALGKIGIWP